ncbi:hypothetical protein NCCP1664_27050 [Zafaria cholistanensis]|uniref:LppM domain-containing protein n=1 Tax=Zafaria cholistanensis TaxID=1682741 RepID=A0A5A7NTK3_9MICC|nr:hypothetical protein [Zafaria cholistanensis]GER24210.1 hypothetical protein NCCP1664_27050 [Zafaria cholistanensis]
MKKVFTAVPLLFALLLALTGCVKLNVDLVVNSAESADSSMVIAVSKEALGGRSVEEMFALVGNGSDPFAGMPAATARADYEDAEYAGYRFTMADQVPNAEFSRATGGWSLDHLDGRFYFTADGAALGMQDQQARALYSEARVSVTFPGQVLEASPGAVIEGNKVNFNLLDNPGTRMTAVAEDSATGISGPLWLLAGAIILAGGIFALALALRPAKPATHAGGEHQPPTAAQPPSLR